MAAIPIIIFDSGFVHTDKGSLLTPPSELFSGAQMSFYSSCQKGWTICPLGYSVYSEFDSLGRKLVVPAIYPIGGPSPKRKFPSYPLKFEKSQIVDFAKSHLNISDEIKSARDTEFKNLTHDLRGISKEIYHTALELKNDDFLTPSPRVLKKAEAVVNWQQMMSLRLDFVDYESGLSSSRPNEKISPYKKVDKVVRCFSNRASKLGIRMNIQGHQNESLFGPPIFELIIFAIIDNAVKYAPKNSEITIRFEESDNQLIIRFESFGPEISSKESNKIFERNYRGDKTEESFKSGSGIGLYAAKTIVDTHFEGEIFVNQFEGEILQDDILYYSTRFTIILPINK